MNISRLKTVLHRLFDGRRSRRPRRPTVVRHVASAASSRSQGTPATGRPAAARGASSSPDSVLGHSRRRALELHRDRDQAQEIACDRGRAAGTPALRAEELVQSAQWNPPEPDQVSAFSTDRRRRQSGERVEVHRRPRRRPARVPRSREGDPTGRNPGRARRREPARNGSMERSRRGAEGSRQDRSGLALALRVGCGSAHRPAPTPPPWMTRASRLPHLGDRRHVVDLDAREPCRRRAATCRELG